MFLGARGDTEKELSSVLNVQGHGDSRIFATKFRQLNSNMNITLRSANAMFIEKTFDILPSHRQLIRKNFNSTIVNVDFVGSSEKVRQEINAWVEKRTENKIRNLLSPQSISSSTRLALVNALYMKTEWKSRFNPVETKREQFFLHSGLTKDVRLMHQRSVFPYVFSKEFDADIVELPFKGEVLSMMIFLPRDRGLSGMLRLESSLSAEVLKQVLKQLSKEEVKLSLPKFKVSSSINLKDILKRLGVSKAFEERDADFSGITGSKNLYISAANQKVFLSNVLSLPHVLDC